MPRIVSRPRYPSPMSDPRRLTAPRGTHDVLPDDQPYWDLVLGAATRVARRYGYRRIDTPVFEDAAVWLRTTGDSTDIVRKEMYVFQDRGGEGTRHEAERRRKTIAGSSSLARFCGPCESVQAVCAGMAGGPAPTPARLAASVRNGARGSMTPPGRWPILLTVRNLVRGLRTPIPGPIARAEMARGAFDLQAGYRALVLDEVRHPGLHVARVAVAHDPQVPSAVPRREHVQHRPPRAPGNRLAGVVGVGEGRAREVLGRDVGVGAQLGGDQRRSHHDAQPGEQVRQPRSRQRGAPRVASSSS